MYKKVVVSFRAARPVCSSSHKWPRLMVMDLDMTWCLGAARLLLLDGVGDGVALLLALGDPGRDGGAPSAKA